MSPLQLDKLSTIALKMSIRYEADYTFDILYGRGTNVTDHHYYKEEKSLCHQFTINYDAKGKADSAKLLPGQAVEKEWLFGPASLRKTKTVIYPCSRNKCIIPCACRKCRIPNRGRPSLRCQVPASCSCDECLQEFEDHTLFHGTFHQNCKYCRQMLQIRSKF